jgi:hypothetical protein
LGDSVELWEGRILHPGSGIDRFATGRRRHATKATSQIEWRSAAEAVLKIRLAIAARKMKAVAAREQPIEK